METESKRRVEQLRLLLDVGKSIVTQRNLRAMTAVVSAYLRQVIHCDEVWMLLAEPGSEQMRVFGLDMNLKGEAIASEGQLVSIEGTAQPRVMKTLETLIVEPSILKNSPSPFAQSLIASGVQSGCIAPLVSQGRALGTVTMASKREHAFTPEDAELFTHVAGQLAAAVENALAALSQYDWPGNVRELENIIERAAILTRGQVLEIPLRELKPAGKKAGQRVAAGELTLEDLERVHILHTLEATDWVVGGPGGAAARLGMKRSTLQGPMQKLGISRQG